LGDQTVVPCAFPPAEVSSMSADPAHVPFSVCRGWSSQLFGDFRLLNAADYSREDLVLALSFSLTVKKFVNSKI
jgi:hypothetical protein